MADVCSVRSGFAWGPWGHLGGTSGGGHLWGGTWDLLLPPPLNAASSLIASGHAGATQLNRPGPSKGLGQRVRSKCIEVEGC